MRLSPEEYDKWYYTKKGKYISGLEKKVLLKMIKPSAISHQLSAIDIGCGAGYFTQFLGTLCRNVVGIDTDMDMIRYARSHAGRGNENHKGSNINYLVADAESLPFKDRSFDIALTITSVNFLKNPAKAVSEAIRVSREKIFLGVLNKWSLLSVFKKLKGLFKETSYSDACFYSQKEITNIFSILEFPLPSGERVGVRGIQTRHTYFLPFPKMQLILSRFEMIIPSWLPFGGFMGITGDI
ncbi:MAG: class I SAM-dependent methyltransferase [Nitrospinota bacterium]